MASPVGTNSNTTCASATQFATTYKSSSTEDICMVRNIPSAVLQNMAICCSTNGTAVNTTADGCWSYCAFPSDQASWFQKCVGDAAGDESLCIKAGGSATSTPVHSDAPTGVEAVKRPMMLGLIVFGLLMFS